MFRSYLMTLVICLIGCLSELNGQQGLSIEYTMNDCTLSDNIGGLDGIIFGLSCVCGVQVNGLSFGGTSNFAEFDSGLNEVLRGDWTISFYIQVKNQGTQSVDILFLGERCGLDSILSLRYLPGSQRFRFVLSDSPNNEVQLDGLTDNNSCWQYVAITKERAVVKLYINGVLASEDAGRSDLVLNVNSSLTIANSPCQNIANNTDSGFQGTIDELRIYNRALSVREVNDADYQPDKIVTSDTTIFSGTSIRLETGGSCSDDFNWSPVTDLNDPNILNPIASPDEDVTYTLTVNGDNCLSVEQINVRVADQSVVTCSDLLLPSAFTPNDDRINDLYGISNRFLISDLVSFEIFNRWGGRVFQTNDIQGSWDGTYQGSPAPPTSYIYKIVYQCESQVYSKSGAVNLIR